MLDTLWRASWQGGLAMLAILVFTCWLPRLLKRPTPAGPRAWLLWIAIMQLPLRAMVAIPIPVSVPAPIAAANPVVIASAPSAPVTPEPIVPKWQPAPEPVEPPKRDPSQYLILAYLLGLTVAAAAYGLRLIQTAKLLKTARAIDDPRAAGLLQQTAEAFDMKNPTLWESDSAPCPLLAGLLRPRIVLPKETWPLLTDDELKMTFAHELAHLRRNDLWRETPVAAVKLAFFFHPLVWLSAGEMTTACEEACDQAALLATGGSPSAYANLLIRSAKGRFHAIAMGSSLGYLVLQRRLKMIKENAVSARSNGFRWTCVAGLAALVAAPYSLVAAQTPAQNAPKTKPKAKTSHAAHKNKLHTSRTVKSTLFRRISPNPNLITTPKGVRISEFKGTQDRFLLLPATAVAVNTTPKEPKLTPSSHDRVTIHVVNVSLNTALAQVFDAAGVNFTIRSSVHDDTVSCSVHNYPFRDAIDTILSSVNQRLICRQQGEMYIVEPAPLTPPGPKPSLEISPAHFDSMDSVVPSLEFENVDVREGLRVLFKNAGINYTIAPDVQGTVTLSMRNCTLNIVLQNILRQVDSTYRIDGKVVMIVKREQPVATGNQK